MMKYILFSISLLIGNRTVAQTKATTEKGEKVVLFDDGTWQYSDSLSIEEQEQVEVIKTSDLKFEKASNAKTLTEGKIWKYGIWNNNVKWGISTSSKSQDLYFKMKTGDAYVMTVAEEIEIPVETLATVAFENAKNRAPDAKLLKKEYRIVNGLKVIHLQIEGTLSGIHFIYSGYYYSCSKGSVQVVGFTAANLFPKFEKDIESFLNGFVGEKTDK